MAKTGAIVGFFLLSFAVAADDYDGGYVLSDSGKRSQKEYVETPFEILKETRAFDVKSTDVKHVALGFGKSVWVHSINIQAYAHGNQNAEVDVYVGTKHEFRMNAPHVDPPFPGNIDQWTDTIRLEGRSGTMHIQRITAVISTRRPREFGRLSGEPAHDEQVHYLAATPDSRCGSCSRLPFYSHWEPTRFGRSYMAVIASEIDYLTRFEIDGVLTTEEKLYYTDPIHSAAIRARNRAMHQGDGSGEARPVYLKLLVLLMDAEVLIKRLEQYRDADARVEQFLYMRGYIHEFLRPSQLEIEAVRRSMECNRPKQMICPKNLEESFDEDFEVFPPPFVNPLIGDGPL